jgi:hypothetical protein
VGGEYDVLSSLKAPRIEKPGVLVRKYCRPQLPPTRKNARKKKKEKETAIAAP